MHPEAWAFPVASTGAAAQAIFDRDPNLQHEHPELRDEISYLTLMRDLIHATLTPRHTPAGPKP